MNILPYCTEVKEEILGLKVLWGDQENEEKEILLEFVNLQEGSKYCKINKFIDQHQYLQGEAQITKNGEFITHFSNQGIEVIENTHFVSENLKLTTSHIKKDHICFYVSFCSEIRIVEDSK